MNKTERSETMLPCVNEHCGMQSDMLIPYLRRCLWAEDHSSYPDACHKYTTTRPDAKDTTLNMEKLEAIEKGITILQAELATANNEKADMVAALKFLISFVPKWVMVVPLGLDPTMYGTNSRKGDMEAHEKYLAITKILDQHK